MSNILYGVNIDRLKYSMVKEIYNKKVFYCDNVSDKKFALNYDIFVEEEYIFKLELSEIEGKEIEITRPYIQCPNIKYRSVTPLGLKYLNENNFKYKDYPGLNTIKLKEWIKHSD